MKINIKSYQKGGPVTPNYQTLGNIKFDSNTSRRGPYGQMIVKDEFTGKDFGVVRNSNGTYNFYDGKDRVLNTKYEFAPLPTSKYEPGLRQIVNSPQEAFFRDYIKSPKFDERASKALIRSSIFREELNRNKYIAEQDPAYMLNQSKVFTETSPRKLKLGATSNTTVDKDMQDESVYAHELSHATGLDGAGSYLTAEQLNKIETKYIKNKDLTGHDKLPYEYKADIDAARFLLRKHKIYDASIEDFKDVHLKKLKENEVLMNDFIIKRLFRVSKNERVLKDAFNTLVDNIEQTNGVQHVVYGGQINNMKKKKCAVGGDLQSPNGIDLLSMGLSLVPGWGQIAGPALGMVSGLVKKQQAEKELRNTVITGTPGNFAWGGLLRNSFSNVRAPRDSIYQAQYNAYQQYPQALQMTDPIKAGVYDKLNQFATDYIQTPYGDALRKGFAQGGDLPLNSGAFQVKGNPSTTDGNDYNYKGSPIALDHNEVVDTSKNFVFSDIITNPLTGKSFAKEAALYEKSTGKAEKQVKMNNSEEAKNTIKHNERISSSLAQLQEVVKLVADTSSHSKSKDRFREKAEGGYIGYAAGGPLPWEGFDVANFQNWYNTMPGVTPLTADAKWGPKTEQAYKQASFDYMNYTGKNKVDNVGGMSIPNYADNTFKSITPNNGALFPSSIGDSQKIPYKADPANVVQTPDGPVDMSELGVANPSNTPLTIDQRANNTTPFVSQSGESFPMTEVGSSTQAGNLVQGSRRGAIGDALQGIEVMSKFFGTMQPAEHQNPYLDNTRITKQTYDPRPALQQNDRNFNNAVSGLSTPSINLRRALTNKMYASKLESDNQVTSQYDSMNKQALGNYENQVSNQRRYNNQQEYVTGEANQRNRAAKDQAVQNAFTSLGNFGEVVNRKDQSYESLRLLKELYPDVYDRIMMKYSNNSTTKK